MSSNNEIRILLFSLFLNINCFASQIPDSLQIKGTQDSDLEKQLIYNGKIWRNLFIGIKGDPYFLSGEFLWGNIWFNGKEFRDLRIKYDIFNDEVVIWVDLKTIIFLNKEMVSEFTIDNRGRSYHILNMGSDSAGLIRGFVNVLYDGPTALLVKYMKKIDLQPHDRMNAVFYQKHHIYIRKDSTIMKVNGRRRLYNLLGDRKTDARNYVKRNQLSVSGKDPDSFIRILEFYDGIAR